MKLFLSANLLLGLSMLIFSVPASAQKKNKKEPKSAAVWEEKIPDSTAEEMPVPDPLGFVSDFGNVFTVGQEDTLTALIKAFSDSTGDELAVIAWDTLHLAPDQVDAYVKKLADDWDIGEDGKRNGVIIAFSVQLRKIRVQNVHGGLTDKEAWEVVHKVMLPLFATKNYYAGTLQGVQSVIKKLSAE